MLGTHAKLVWVTCFGWWVATIWGITAFTMCWNPIGWTMWYQLPGIVSGRAVGL